MKSRRPVPSRKGSRAPFPSRAGTAGSTSRVAPSRAGSTSRVGPGRVGSTSRVGPGRAGSTSRVAPSRERMLELLERSGLHLDAEAASRLWRFDQLLRARNRDRDLTRLIEFESVVIKHYVDSMYVTRLTDLPSPLVDVGTGAGFPGIPLKILLPHLDLTLAEQRPRRVAFLEEAIRSLGLARVRTFDHRVVSRSFTEPMRGVITRAVEPIGKTLLRTSGCTSPGSRLIFMKGPGVDAELAEAVRDFAPDYRLVRDEAYTLPFTSHHRRLVIFERLAADPDDARAGQPM